MKTNLIMMSAIATIIAGCGGSGGGSDESDVGIPITSANVVGSVAISGTTTENETLTATVTDNNGITGTIIYQWAADGVDIAGAINQTFVITSSQVNTNLSVAVNYTDNDGFVESVTSSSTNTIEGVATNVTGSVLITGTTTEDETLTATVTDNNGATGTISYQWAANGTNIIGATTEDFVPTDSEVNTTLSVTANYTDDDGFVEEVTSVATAIITATNDVGVLTISGIAAIGSTLTSAVTDADGISNVVSYQWIADDFDLAGETSPTLVLNDTLEGATIIVRASYIDDQGFVEVIDSSATLEVLPSPNVAVNDAAELVAAIAAASVGDTIELNTGSWADIGELTVDKAITLTAAQGESPIISGELCLVISNNASAVNANTANAQIIGLTFDSLDGNLSNTACAGSSNGRATILVEAEFALIAQNTFSGDANTITTSSSTGTTDNENNTLNIDGDSITVERNLFTGRDLSNEGASIRINSDAAGAIIQYNVFKDFIVSDDTPSSAYPIQAGSTTGSSALDASSMRIQFNLFSAIPAERRIIRVQTTDAFVTGNTILESEGAIALEDGSGIEVTDNVIIRTTEDSDNDDSGILIHGFGHSVTNNYIAGIHSNNTRNGGIVLTGEEQTRMNDAFSSLIVNTDAADLTVTISNNTILNTEQPLAFNKENQGTSGIDCGPTSGDILTTRETIIADYSANLIVNGLDNTPATEGLYLSAVDNTSDHAIEYDCNLLNQASSTFANNHFYTDSIIAGDAQSDTNEDRAFDVAANITDIVSNILSSDTAADQVGFTGDLSASSVTGLIQATAGGIDDGIGADTTNLIILTDAEVGPGTTWVSPTAVTIVDDSPNLSNVVWVIDTQNTPNQDIDGEGITPSVVGATNSRELFQFEITTTETTELQRQEFQYERRFNLHAFTGQFRISSAEADFDRVSVAQTHDDQIRSQGVFSIYQVRQNGDGYVFGVQGDTTEANNSFDSFTTVNFELDTWYTLDTRTSSIDRDNTFELAKLYNEDGVLVWQETILGGGEDEQYKKVGAYRLTNGFGRIIVDWRELTFFNGSIE